MSSRRWLILIVMAGALLRVIPVWFGVPYMDARPDEEVGPGIARRIIAGQLNPDFFHWPSLTFYLFAAVYYVASTVLGLVGFDSTLTPAQHLIACRLLVAGAGSATVLVLFTMARRVGGETVALSAAALLAVAVLHVRDSHFAMTDVLMTFLVTASLALLLRALDARQLSATMKWFAVAGAAGGLATSTKYNGGAILAAMAAAQLLILFRSPRTALSPRAWAPGGAFILAFAAAFLCATPYALLDHTQFTRDLQFVFTHLAQGHGVDLGRGWVYHAIRSLPYGVGPVVFVAAIPGAVLLAREKPQHALVIGSFFLALYISIGSGYTVFFRYILPLVPLVCLAAAVAARASAEWLARRAHVAPAIAWTVVLVLGVLPGLANSVWFDLLLARTDTRVLAARWLAPRLGADDTLHDAGGKYASLDLSALSFHRLTKDDVPASFGEPNGRKPDWLVLCDSPLFIYARVPPVLRDLAQREYTLMTTIRATRFRARSAVYDQQDAFFMPVWGFWTVERPGPTIRIYRKDLR